MMVQAVRAGVSIRTAAKHFRVSVGQVHFWVERCHGQRLHRCDFSDRKRGPRRPWNRSAPELEERVLSVRRELKVDSVLGEYGAPAIRQALLQDRTPAPPSVATISRILRRRGAVDGVGRHRRPPPPRGWYLPPVARGQAELDSFDVVEDLKVKDGPWFSVLTAVALLGGQVQAWPREQLGAKHVVECLLAHWQQLGLCAFAQFDNDTLFQGAHQFADTMGRVSRLCLQLGVIPVFAPPREPGFQNAIEGFNALWQAKVWQRFAFPDLPAVRTQSDLYISAHRRRNARRSEAAPPRAAVPPSFQLDLRRPPQGTLIYLRRTDANGQIALLGHQWLVDAHWVHRLVRCEVRLDESCIQCFALRRREPAEQPLLATIPYQFPAKRFQGEL